jgi:site-specific DNA recombinase
MLRAALYIRVSTEEQKIHGLSVETQKESLTKWARDNNCEIIDYYIDAGKTARKNLKSRSELQRLLQDVKTDKVDLIIFTKLDRWFRNIRDYYKIQDIIESHNVNWKTIFENYDTSTANGRLHINIMLSVAQDEADRTSERIKVVFQNKLKNGEAISGSLPIGYKIVDKRVVPDEETAQIAIDLFDTYLIEQSQTKVFKVIKERYGIHLCEKTISRALKNPIYAGTYRGHGNFCDPLISPEKFNAVQEILKKRNIRYAPTERVFLFTGLLECSECHHIMVANAQIRDYKSGRKEYVAYRCHQHYARHLCGHNKIIYESKIEEYLFSEIIPKLAEASANFTPATKKKTRPVNKAEVKKKLEKLKDLYVNDIIEIDLYRADYDKYMNMLKTEEVQEPVIDISHYEEFIKSGYMSTYKSLSQHEKRLAWRSVIDRLIIGPNNEIEIVLIKRTR